MTFILSLMSRNISSVDVDEFLSYLPEYVSKSAFMIKNSENLRNQDLFNPQTGIIQPLEREDWGREPYLGIAQNAILAFQASAVCSGRSEVRDELAARIDDIEGASSALKPFLERFNSDLSALGDARDVAATCIGRLSDADNVPNPDELFMITCRLWNWLAYSDFKLLLPAGLGFAGGAMIYLVVSELIPDSLAGCSKKETAWGVIIGLLLMLLLTSGLGL